MSKYYFLELDEERCYNLEYTKDLIKGQNLKEKEVYEAKLVKTDDEYMYCKIAGDVGERGYCGKQCLDYKPRNGKWGICKHQGNLYECGEKILIKV